jgi:hypothetical protein
VTVWYVAPLEMNEETHWGQGYNQPTKGCSAEERPNKRPLTVTPSVFYFCIHIVVFRALCGLVGEYLSFRGTGFVAREG